MKNIEIKLPKGLLRQREYLNHRQKSNDNDNSFFITERVMESMRDSGYRDVRRAINDIIDNSEQAGATKIAVVATTCREDIKNAKEKVCDIAIVDNGHGMYPDMLEDAVKWGGTDRHNQRDGLGRFGFGLPTAAISVTRTYEVYSKVKGGEWHKILVDLNLITKTAMAHDNTQSITPKYEKTELPKFLKEYIKKNWDAEDLEQGTIVLLLNADRIRSFALPPIFQAKMMQNIGLTYRYYIPRITFWVNEKKVDMIDPLFLNPNSIGYEADNGLMAEGADEMIIRVKNRLADNSNIEGDIRLRFTHLHPRFQRDKNNSIINNRWQTMKQNNGYFIVCRAGRQIDVVKEPNYPGDTDNFTLQRYDAQWSIELNFDPVLDELFGITTNKQQVEIDSYLWEVFKEKNIPAIVSAFRKKDLQLRDKEEVDDEKNNPVPKQSETVMKDAEKYEKKSIPEEKQEKADEKLDQDAEEKAKAEDKDPEIVKEELRTEAQQNKYKIELTNYPGAPFYEIDLWGPQERLKLNIAHRFYKDIYSTQDARGKAAIELLLFVIGGRELESNDAMQLFYNQERYEWSKRLDLRLRLLDQLDPLVDKKVAKEDANAT